MLIMLKWMLEQQLYAGGCKLGDDPVVIDALFDVAPIVCEVCVFCPYFVIHNRHVLSFLVLQSS